MQARASRDSAILRWHGRCFILASCSARPDRTE